MAAIKYDVVEKIAVLSQKGEWTKELNMVSWNDRPAKFDIRDWNHQEGKIGKGVTLTESEINELKDAIEKLEI
ncbi:YdbC family protein [Alkalibacter mobilis]|uniref:YdbC family protein n=1 Tax=Alkalibacter mobilis TaxID=2787712 RepID=UPI00189C7B21|nr:PC4/YdbC family ssDNA-binding protein [Alkalibacter mobilis]MBF7096459.1 hypothetical protein [Alkalibacter mobilis]